MSSFPQTVSNIFEKRDADSEEFYAWKKRGREIVRGVNGYAWELGDWLLKGQKAYGRDWLAAIEITGMAESTLNSYKHVAGKFQDFRRRKDLSFGHHEAVAALAPPDADLWLERAAAEGWSVGVLRDELRALKRAPEPAEGEGLVVAVVYKFRVSPETDSRLAKAVEEDGFETVDTWVEHLVERELDRRSG